MIWLVSIDGMLAVRDDSRWTFGMNASDFGFEMSNHGDGFEIQVGVMPAMASLVRARVEGGVTSSCGWCIDIVFLSERESKQMPTATGVSRVQGKG